MIMEADMSLTSMAMDEGGYNRYKDDHRLLVTFYIKPIQDAALTLKEGRPMFIDTECVRIMTPGDKSSILDRTAHAEDKMRFAKQYQQFKAGAEQAQVGTPLEAWPMVTRAQVEELKFFGIRTVESLAEIADVHAQKFMGINMLRQRARDYVEAAKGTQPMAEMRAQLEEKDNEIQTLNKAMADLAARVAAMEA
jgi:hypothetical protein